MSGTSAIELNSSNCQSYQLATEKSLGSNSYLTGDRKYVFSSQILMNKETEAEHENDVVEINVEDRENTEDTKLPQQHSREPVTKQNKTSQLTKQTSEQVRVIGSTVAKTVFVSNDDRIDLTLGTTAPDNFTK
jgi:hypothetical protein